jgi:hypothetical protein
MTPARADVYRRTSGSPDAADREKIVNAAHSNGCCNHLRQYHNCHVVIRSNIAQRGAALAADLAAQYAHAQHDRYHMAEILLDQAVRDLSQAHRDFWRAGDRRERRRCLVWIRRCDGIERHRRAVRAELCGVWVRACRAAKECVA